MPYSLINGWSELFQRWQDGSGHAGVSKAGVLTKKKGGTNVRFLLVCHGLGNSLGVKLAIHVTFQCDQVPKSCLVFLSPFFLILFLLPSSFLYPVALAPSLTLFISYRSMWMRTGPGRFLCASGGIHLHPGLPATVWDSLLQLPGLHRGGGGVRPGQDLPPPLLCLLLLQVRDMSEVGNRITTPRSSIKYVYLSFLTGKTTYS